MGREAQLEAWEEAQERAQEVCQEAQGEAWHGSQEGAQNAQREMPRRIEIPDVAQKELRGEAREGVRRRRSPGGPRGRPGGERRDKESREDAAREEAREEAAPGLKLRRRTGRGGPGRSWLGRARTPRSRPQAGAPEEPREGWPRGRALAEKVMMPMTMKGRDSTDLRRRGFFLSAASAPMRSSTPSPEPALLSQAVP